MLEISKSAAYLVLPVALACGAGACAPGQAGGPGGGDARGDDADATVLEDSGESSQTDATVPGDAAGDAESGTDAAGDGECGAAPVADAAGDGESDAAPVADAAGDGESDAAPVADAAADADAEGGLLCDAMAPGVAPQPLTWCIDGSACTPPSNQCNIGALSCGSLACGDTETPVPDGTPCSSGTCQHGVCSEACTMPAGSTHGCLLGPCSTGACTSISGGLTCEFSQGSSMPLAPDGMECGRDPHQICRAGACAVGDCVSNTECGANERCDAPAQPCTSPLFMCGIFSFQCVSDPCMSFGVSVADGTQCGSDSVCSGGQCLVQLTVSGSAVTFTPGAVFSGTLANVNDSFASDTASSLTATIDWGDGSVSAGTVSGSSSPFAVSGTHTYAAQSAVILTVTVTDVGTGTAAAARFPGTVGQSFITEFPVPNGANGIAAGADGNLWFSEYGATNIGRMTPQGVVTEFGLPSGVNPVGITGGPDGNLWFISRAGGPSSSIEQIGRITTAGVATEFAIPTQGSFPQFGIAAGPDGNVWFTEDENSKVGRVTPLGVITEFAVPSATGAITTGPDGNLWFVETSANAIGRITPGGQVAEFPIGSCALAAGAFPAGITRGSDGNLWFTVSSSSGTGTFVGRMSTTGAIVSTFALPIANSDPRAITAGPDGNVWLVDHTNYTIDRVTVAGVFTLFALPAGGFRGYGPIAIVAGADGNMWFTEEDTVSASGRIGRISP